MAALSVLAPYPIFNDRDGQPIDDGNIYVGTANLNPITNPIQIYWDKALTIAANQPIKTNGGYPSFQGTPSALYVNADDFSITVTDKSGLLVYTSPNNSLRISTNNISNINADDVKYTPTGANAVSPVYVSDVLDNFVYVSEYATPSAAALAAYNANAQMLVKTGQSVALVCNPTAGDNLQAMCNWISSRGHYVEEGGELYLQIADGLHNVSTYVDITDARFLDIRGTAAPDLISISSATFSGTSGNVTATINVASALPARVQTGFAVGGQNVQGDGGADLLNGGMIVLNRVSSTQFTALLYSNGTNLAAFTTPDATPSLGLTPNQLVIPQNTIRAAEAGWDGAIREGFMNALRGAKINLTYVGLSYNGAAGDNDMLFARDAGSEIYLRDYCVVAGTGEMVLRTFNYANIATYRSYLGGGQTGANIWQGSGGGTLNATRTMMGSVTDDAISCSSGARVWASQCVVAGANIGLRTTYPDSSIDAAGTRVSRCNLGIAPTNGRILIDTASSIKNCTTPISITGSNGGTAYGNPTISGNTNATVTPFAIQASSGGVWIQSAAPTYDAGFYKVGRFTGTLDFPSISANSYADLTLAATGTALGDFCVFTRSGTWPAQGISYQAFVSATDTLTVRAYNITTGAIDPTAFTALVLVMRAT